MNTFTNHGVYKHCLLHYIFSMKLFLCINNKCTIIFPTYKQLTLNLSIIVETSFYPAVFNGRVLGQLARPVAPQTLDHRVPGLGLVFGSGFCTWTRHFIHMLKQLNFEMLAPSSR